MVIKREVPVSKDLISRYDDNEPDTEAPQRVPVSKDLISRYDLSRLGRRQTQNSPSK